VYLFWFTRGYFLEGQHWLERALELAYFVELAYFAGLTHVEIADRLQIPLGTVKGRLRLAMERLRSLLQPGACAVAQT
jgi:DNA-directed RNA polymerase specialized sigma24 family protein